MVTINQLAQLAIDISGKNIKINNIFGEDFIKKYGHKCPLGVKGRNSDNSLIFKELNWKPTQPLKNGLIKTFEWINSQVN
jgi:nucleoside-diphosphate-sugar epimerase